MDGDAPSSDRGSGPMESGCGGGCGGEGGRAQGSLGPSRHSWCACPTGGKFSTRTPGPPSASHSIPPAGVTGHALGSVRSGRLGLPYDTRPDGMVVKGPDTALTRKSSDHPWSDSCGFPGGAPRARFRRISDRRSESRRSSDTWVWSTWVMAAAMAWWPAVRSIAWWSSWAMRR